jgi:cell division initiation protein
MELTPQILHDVQFRERWRGYDQEEVDDFLERVAASLEKLLSRLKGIPERTGGTVENGEPLDEEAIKRTLVLAQRTADAAVKEAKDQAETLVRDAEQRAETLVTEAEAEGRRALEESREQVAGEVAALEERRDALLGDVEALDQYLVEQRQYLEEAAAELRRLADDPLALRGAPRPELKAPMGVGPTERGAAPDPEAVAAARALVGDQQAPAMAPVGAGAVEDEGGPPTQGIVISLDDDSGTTDEASEDDPFLDELRKAVSDAEPLGPREDDDEEGQVPLYDQDYLDGARGSLRARLKRRG